MADYNSALPVRTYADADERLQTKIIDYTNPALGQTVDSDGNAHAEMHGNNPSGTDVVQRLSENGHGTLDGIYNAGTNTDPSQVGLVACTRAATPADSDQVKRLTAITNSDVHALDVAIRDEAGVPFSSSNPMPVVQVESEGTEINDYLTSAAVAAGASVNHDYTVTALKTLILTQVEASASGRAKIEVQVETGVASGTFNTRFVQFNSTANPNFSITLREPISVAAGVRVRVIRTNRENQAQDLFSTISGHEV